MNVVRLTFDFRERRKDFWREWGGELAERMPSGKELALARHVESGWVTYQLWSGGHWVPTPGGTQPKLDLAPQFLRWSCAPSPRQLTMVLLRTNGCLAPRRTQDRSLQSSLCREHGGKWILSVEDTDAVRVPRYSSDAWLGV